MARKRFRDDTEYLMASPTNARRLLASIRECERGNVVVRELVEPSKRVSHDRESAKARKRGRSHR